MAADGRGRGGPPPKGVRSSPRYPRITANARGTGRPGHGPGRLWAWAGRPGGRGTCGGRRGGARGTSRGREVLDEDARNSTFPQELRTRGRPSPCPGRVKVGLSDLTLPWQGQVMQPGSGPHGAQSHQGAVDLWPSEGAKGRPR